MDKKRAILRILILGALDEALWGWLVRGVIVGMITSIWAYFSELPSVVIALFGFWAFIGVIFLLTLLKKVFSKSNNQKPIEEQLSQKHGASISNSYSTGNVTAGKGSSNVGGFIGGIHTGQPVGSEALLPQETIDWLQETLIFNQQNIYKALKGRIIGWKFSGINSPDPYFEICLEEINTSIFTIHFIGGSGSLFINGIECLQQPKMNEQWGLEQGKTFEVTLKQGVSKDVADIIRAASNKSNIKFDLRQFHLHFETTTKGYEGLKPLVRFDREYEVQPNINTNLLVLHKADYRI